MRGFHTMLQRMLKDSERRRKQLAFVLALSMMVTLAVPLGTMKPAISATGKTLATPLLAASGTPNGTGWDGEYAQDGAPAEAPAGAVNFGDVLTKVSMNPVTLDGGNESSVHGSFKLEYQFDKGSGVGEGGASYIYYQIPENITGDVDIYGETFKTVDTSGEYATWYLKKYGVNPESSTVGYYTINKDTGVMIIKFTEDYLKYISDQEGAFTGKINFDGNVQRSQTEEGDQHIDFGGSTIPVDVTFNDKTLDLSKSGRLASADYEFPKVEWTVTITNQDGFFDLTNSILNDVDLARAESVTIEPANAGTYTSGSQSIDLTGVTDANGKAPTSIIIKYVVTPTAQELAATLSGEDPKMTNKADLIDNDHNRATKTAEAEVPMSANKASVEKSAKASYEIDGSVGNDGYIQWTMTVTRPYGQSLDGYVVNDEMWTSTTDLTFDPAGAGAMDSSGNVVLDTNQSKVTITYKTPRPDGGEGEVTNKAKVTPPDSDTPDDEEEITKKYSEESLIDVSKSGTFVSKTNSILWTITVNASGDNAKSLSDYVIKDEQLAALSSSDTAATDLKVVSATKNGQPVEVVEFAADFTTFRINTQEDIDSLTISYIKKLSEDQIYTAGYGETEIENTAIVEDEDEPDVQYPATGVARVPEISDNVSKAIVGSKSLTEEGYFSEDDKPSEKKLDIQWKVAIDSYTGITLAPYVDTMDQTYGDNFLKSAITSINASSVKGQSGTALTAGTDFNVTYYDAAGNALSGFEADKVTKFEINFLESDNYGDGDYYFDFTYTSTANVLDVENGTSAYFKNTGVVGPNQGDDTFTYTRTQPETITLNTRKIWSGDLESMHANKTVSVTLQQKLGANGTWKDYTYPSGSTKSSTVQLNSQNVWQTDWGELPKHANDENKTPYYYRIVETGTVEGYTTSYTFDQNAGVNSDDWLNVNNVYDKLCITAVKNWTDDLNEPVEVTLERKPSDASESEWAAVATGAVQTLSSSNSFTYTWEDLDKGYDYRVVEKDVKAGYRVKYSAQSVNTTSTITITNEPDVITIRSRKIWSGDQGYESSRPSSVTLVLQKREEFSNQGWSEVDRKTITSDNWSELAEWSDLPAKNTENGHAIYYRVAEPDQISGYVTDFDEDGSNTDAQLDVTNVYDSLILKGHKEWIGDSAFKSDRPATVTFKLQRKTDSQTSWSDVADTEKTLTKNSNNEFDDVSWEPQPKRDPEGELYTYRIIEDPVPQGYVSQSSETRSSGWLTVTNTSTKIKIVVSKRWLNDSAVSAQRPSLDILLQSKEGEDGQWTTVEKKKLNVSANTTSTVEFNGLPTMSENGEPYYYRAVEETVPDGYKESYAVKINDNERSEINQEKGVYLTKDTNLEITNDYSLAYTKTAVDEKGKPITQESIKGMKTHMLDVNKSGSTDEVYVIKYSVDFTQATGFEDRLPANFRFLNIEGYKPKYYYSNDPKNATDMYELATQANIDGATFRAYYYDSVANNLYLQTEGAGRIEYYVYILKEDMPEITSAGYNIINRITSRNEGSETVTSTLKITDEKDYLTKQVQLGDRQQSGRMFSYILDVNPEGRFITNDGTIVITDLFNITGVGYQSGAITKGRGLVDAAFSNLQVYDVDKGETLQLGDYTYTIDYGSNIATEVDITSDYEMETTEASDNPGRYTYSVVGNFKSGDTIVMKMYGSPNQYHYGAFKLDWTEAATIPSQLDENGELEIRYTFTSDFSGTVKLEGYQTTGAELVSVTTKEYPDEADGTLSISVPDGRHIRITYDYELTCNDNTPLRYNNQNVSGVTMAVADPNGTEKVKLGDNLPAGSVVTAENSASLQSNKGEETSDSGEQELVAQYTQAENASGGVPKIEKVNIGNYAISTLKATFRIAKYDRVNGWVYATGFSEGTDQTPGEIEFDRVLTESNGYMPEDAAKIVIDGRTKTYLENGTLYKFVEIVAPEGYKPTGWTDEAPLSLDELDEFTFYFINNVTSTTAMPAGFDPETANYVSGGKALDIPNIEMIDIKVSKNWETPEDLNGQTSTSKVELLWSDKKSATIPANAKRATPEDLDIDDPDFISTFENVKTLSASTGDATTVWTDLPNGVKGKPIYYYVREISYTIGSTEFKLRDDGSFTTDPDEHGDVIVGTYRPLYVGNGANRSGSEVDITNGRDLVIRKFWKDTGNNDVDGQDVEFKEVGFMLYGIDVQGRKSDDPIFSGKLKRSENWEYDLSGVDLGDYVDFEVVEVVDDPAFDLDLTKAQTRTLRKMYSVSYIKNLNGDIGELTIINKDSTPTKIPYEVKKVWHDGKTEHDPVTVHLYKTKLDLSEYPGWDGSIDPDFVTAVNAAEGDDTIIEVGQQTLSDANEWQYIWKNMDYIYDTDNSLHWFYYVYEDPIDSEKYPGYETEVDYEGDKDGVYATVINSQPEKITIKKVWENTDNYTVPEFVEFELYRTTSQYNVVPDGVPADLDEQKGTESYWKYQYVKNIKLRKSEDWTLEIANVPAVDSSNNKYYYFVREVDTNKMFSISYDGNSATLENSDTITVTNAVKTVDLDLRKQWTDGGEHLNDPITVKVYRTKQSNDNNGQLQAITATPQVLVVKPAANDVITTNCTNIKAVSSDPTVAEVTANSDGTVTVTAKALGETTVTITDNESLSQTTVTVIVSEKAVPVLSIDKKEINAGESAQLTVESVGGELQGEITYSVRVLEGNPNVTVDQATGQVTATNMGKVEITATADGIVSKPVTLTVGLADFTVDAEMEVSTEVSKQIKPDPSYGTFKYTSTDPTKVVVDENTGMVSGVSYTTTPVAVTVTRQEDGVSKTVLVTVKYLPDTFKLGSSNQRQALKAGETIEKMVITSPKTTWANFGFYIGEMPEGWSSIDGNTAVADYNIILDGDGNWSVDSNHSKLLIDGATVDYADGVMTVTFNGGYTVPDRMYIEAIRSWDISDLDVEVWYAQNTNSANSLNAPLSASSVRNKTYFADESIHVTRTFDNDGYIEITFDPSKGDSWQKLVEDLPACDTNGDPYYYYAVENEVAGYKASYLYTDSDGNTTYTINAGKSYEDEITPDILVVNSKESEGASLPETGGEGTMILYTFGALMMFASVFGYVAKRRRRTVK